MTCRLTEGSPRVAEGPADEQEDLRRESDRNTVDELSQPCANQHWQGQSFVWEGPTAGSHHSLTHTHTHHKQAHVDTHTHTLHANSNSPPKNYLMAVVSELP